MHFSPSRLLLIAFTLFGASAASSQCPVMPDGFLCITQLAGNVARDNALELVAVKNQVEVLKGSLVEKDKSIFELKITSLKNESDLRAKNAELLAEIARSTGSLIECKAFAVRDGAMIEFLVKNQRSKQNGVINLKLGGN